MSLKNKIYSNFHLSFMDKITHKKRNEILKVISNYLNDKNLGRCIRYWNYRRC